MFFIVMDDWHERKLQMKIIGFYDTFYVAMIQQWYSNEIIFANKKVFQLNKVYSENHENRAPWNREAPNAGNYQKVVGIIGASNVGKLVIKYLQNLDLKILLYDPFITPLESREMGAMKVGLTELLSQADIVSMHAPLLQETRHMIGEDELALMKNGATIINTARGDLIEPVALLNELVSGRIYGILWVLLLNL